METNYNKEKNPLYSVVIPTYNEMAKREEIVKHLDSIKDYFSRINQNYEILIVLDGPTDGTPEFIKQKVANWEEVKVLDRNENRGKGYSVREGLMAAQGQIRLFTDMDGATPIHMLDRFIPKFQAGADIVIGSRDLKGSQIKVHQPKWKEWAGDFGNLLIQITTGLYGMKDTQCGFKAFTAEVVEDVIPRTTVERWGLDFEILMIGKKLGYKIEEVPVEWIDKGESLVGIGGYIDTFRDLARVKWNIIRGVYQLDKKVKEIKRTADNKK
jgi:dolichyl-phosphate beta-glucosyltransferase